MSSSAIGPSRWSLAVVVVSAIAALVAIGAVGAAAELRGRVTTKNPASVSDDSRARNDATLPVSGPSASAVEPALARHLLALGTAVVRADVTGVGRAQFPGYWSADAYAPCCSAVRVVGEAMTPSATRPGDIDVTVVWDADRSDGGPALRNQESIVPLQPTPFGWGPVPDPTTALSP